MRPSTGTDHHHQALLYGSDEELLAAAVPFVRAGLAARDAVVLLCRADNNARLADELDADGRVVTLPRDGVFTRPANAIAAYRRMVRERLADGARRVRLVTEVDFGGPESWTGWAGFEAVVNVALAPFPLWSVCAYDVRSLPGMVVTNAARTHPTLFSRRLPGRNAQYVDPVTFLRRSRSSPPDPLESRSPAYRSGDLTRLGQIEALRENLRSRLTAAGVPALTRADFLAAIGEVTANGLIHGRPPVRVQVWADRGRLLCTVTDQGYGFDDPLAGYLPDRAGVGLWLARQTCDRIDMSATSGGFTVRLSTAALRKGTRTRLDGARARAETMKARTDTARAQADRLLRRLGERVAERAIRRTRSEDVALSHPRAGPGEPSGGGPHLPE